MGTRSSCARRSSARSRDESFSPSGGRERPERRVEFEALGEERSLVTVEFAYEPAGVTEQLGAKVGLDSRQVRNDLERYKDLIEARGVVRSLAR